MRTDVDTFNKEQVLAVRNRTVTHWIRLMDHGLLLIATLWRKLTGTFGAGYRPELHYMRGPGPKWHEHNSRSSV